MPASSPTSLSHRFKAAILPLAALLWVSVGIGERGVAIHDEGHFLLAANTIVLGLKGVLGGVSLGALAESIHETGGTLFFAAKPGYVGLLALGGIFSGSVSASVALWINALSFVGIVWLTYLVALRRFDWPWAARAVGIFCVASPLLAHSARTALSTTPALFFAMLALWLMHIERRPLLMGALAGASAFFAFTCHYNILPLLLALLVAYWPSEPPRRRMAVIAGAAGCVIAIEGALLAADWLLRDAYPEFRSFFGELYANFTRSHVPGAASALERTDGVRGYGFKAYLYVGILMAYGYHFLGVAALLGCLWAWKSKLWPGGTLRLIAAMIAVPLAFWLLYPWKVERCFVQLAPGIALAGGWTFVRFGQLWISSAQGERADAAPPARVPIYWVLLGMAPAAGAIAVSVFASMPQPSRSPYAETAAVNAEVIARLPAGALTSASFHRASAPLWKWYLGPGFEEVAGEGAVAPSDYRGFGAPLVIARDPLSASAPADPLFAAGEPQAYGERLGFMVSASDRGGTYSLWLRTGPLP
ncbi:MAG: hypothetical protein RLY93_07480 [Sumerlaeia bacterium]